MLQALMPKAVGALLMSRVPDTGDGAAGFDGCPVVFSLALFLWGDFLDPEVSLLSADLFK